MKKYKFELELSFPSTPEEWEFEVEVEEPEKLAGLLGELMVNAAYRVMSVGDTHHLDLDSAFETIIEPYLTKYGFDTTSATYWKAFHQLQKIDSTIDHLKKSHITRNK